MSDIGEDLPLKLDLRQFACPMAFIRARLALDASAPHGIFIIAYCMSAGNESLPASLEQLGASVTQLAGSAESHGFATYEQFADPVQILRVIKAV